MNIFMVDLRVDSLPIAESFGFAADIFVKSESFQMEAPSYPFHEYLLGFQDDALLIDSKWF